MFPTDLMKHVKFFLIKQIFWIKLNNTVDSKDRYFDFVTKDSECKLNYPLFF